MIGVNNPGSAPRKLRQRSAVEAGSELRMLRHLIRTTMTMKARRISPGITPAAKVCETGTLVRALNNIAAFEENALASDDNIRNRLLSLYSELSAYEEVPEVLANLKAAGHRLAVLPNGSPSMLEKAVEAAEIFEWFDELLGVDVLKCYEPHLQFTNSSQSGSISSRVT